MKKGICKLGFGIGILAVGAFYLGLKTGFFETDEDLYDEFDSTIF